MASDASIHTSNRKDVEQRLPELNEHKGSTHSSSVFTLAHQIKRDPRLLKSTDILHLQRFIGNQAVVQLLGETQTVNNSSQIQRGFDSDDEEEVQGPGAPDKDGFRPRASAKAKEQSPPGNRTHTFPKGAVMFHGSDKAQMAQATPASPVNMPTAPAWFTADPEFAMHAPAQMHPSDQAYLHNFTALTDITLLMFSTCEELETYLESNNKKASGGNIKLDARGIKELHGDQCHGYMVEKDKGRGQPEYVLFEEGLKRLKADAPMAMPERDAGNGSREHFFQGRRWGRLTNDGENPPSYSTKPD